MLGYTGFGVLLGVFGLEFGDTKAMVRILELFFTAAFVVVVATAIYRSTRGRASPQSTVVVPVDES